MDLSAASQQSGEKPMFFTKSVSIECEYGTHKTKSNENLNEPSLTTQSSSDKLTDRGYTSDSELYQQATATFSKTSSPTLSQHQMASKKEMVELIIDPNSSMRSPTGLNVSSVNQYKIDLDDVGLSEHDKKAFAKCCETLTFLIRDMAHISLQNFESCIQCLRTFVEACVMADRRKSNQRRDALNNKKNPGPQKSTSQKNLKQQKNPQSSSNNSLDYGSNANSSAYDAMSFGRVDSDDDEQFVSSYETISIQLLDLLDTLHLKAASIFSAWAEGQ
jgi:brefeldin A-resistance guanine nucleotide exchange factor 1